MVFQCTMDFNEHMIHNLCVYHKRCAQQVHYAQNHNPKNIKNVFIEMQIFFTTASCVKNWKENKFLFYNLHPFDRKRNFKLKYLSFQPY